MSDDVDQDRFDEGRALAARLFAGAPPGRRLPREMMRHTMGHVFGDLWQDDRLTVEQRSLITCTILTALGKEAELRLHVRGARNLGIERNTLEAMMLHSSHYAGWPTGVAALRVLDEVWEDMDAVEEQE
ncbi:MAG: carboxymuconolactone decarboxylase family protein [Actinomycetota bacterium]|jgi:4-carboxymuconolactone decarboxylase|nr:carboxymuconolactone decarboxylase family protein [Actinomycetota bacterium]